MEAPWGQLLKSVCCGVHLSCCNYAHCEIAMKEVVQSGGGFGKTLAAGTWRWPNTQALQLKSQGFFKNLQVLAIAFPHNLSVCSRADSLLVSSVSQLMEELGTLSQTNSVLVPFRTLYGLLCTVRQALLEWSSLQMGYFASLSNNVLTRGQGYLTLVRDFSRTFRFSSAILFITLRQPRQHPQEQK